MAAIRRPIADIAEGLIRSNAPADADPEVIKRLVKRVARRIRGEEATRADLLDELVLERLVRVAPEQSQQEASAQPEPADDVLDQLLREKQQSQQEAPGQSERHRNVLDEEREQDTRHTEGHEGRGGG